MSEGSIRFAVARCQRHCQRAHQLVVAAIHPVSALTNVFLMYCREFVSVAWGLSGSSPVAVDVTFVLPQCRLVVGLETEKSPLSLQDFDLEAVVYS